MSEKQEKPKRAAAIFYSEAYKRQIIEEYLHTGMPKMQLQEKYGIKFKSAIATWMRLLDYVDVYQNSSNLPNINQTELPKKTSNKKRVAPVNTTEQEMALLKRQLEDERLRSEMYNRMIDIAEQQYKIAIRKNSNTK
jgi:transposase